MDRALENKSAVCFPLVIKGNIMVDSKIGIRYVTTKKGTYMVWSDFVSGAQRRLILSKVSAVQYFGTGRGSR